MLGNEDKKGYGYKNYIAWNIFGVGIEYSSMESYLVNRKLEKCLDKIIGLKLYKEKRKELKKVFKRYGLNTRTLGINTLNGYLIKSYRNIFVNLINKDVLFYIIESVN